MTVVDVIIISVVIISILISLLRGFIKEAISVAVWITAIWLSVAFSPNLATALPDNIESPAVRLAVGFATLFILTLVVGALVSYISSQVIQKTGLTGADRVLGTAFGLARGLLIIVVFVLIAGMTPINDMHWWGESLLIGRFEVLADWLKEYFPQTLDLSLLGLSEPGSGFVNRDFIER